MNKPSFWYQRISFEPLTSFMNSSFDLNPALYYKQVSLYNHIQYSFDWV